jgi:hypothetical protein
MKARLLLTFMLCCRFFQQVSSQVIESNTNRERNFAFEVKNIDEFIERFNNDKDAFITSYVKANYPGTNVDRQSLILNLFNRKISWNNAGLNKFLQQVTDPGKPAYLDFDSNNWYAEAQCRFIYKGSLVDVRILLKIQQEANGGTKWMIVSASSEAIPPAAGTINVQDNKDLSKYLNSMSHATNFISLNRALNDRRGIVNYLDSNFLKSPYSRAFLKGLLAKQLSFQYVKSIAYHFLQVTGWILTVNRFSRNSVNSGWLINSMKEASAEEKEAYKMALIVHKTEKV